MLLPPIKYWLLFCLIITLVNGYKSGAPTAMCSTMTPHHAGAKSQTTPPPYKLTTTSPNTINGRVGLKVDGGEFVGVFVQARKNPKQPGAFGKFITFPPAIKAITCDNSNNSAITHRDNSKKNEINVEWQSPPDFDGEITFIATVVSEYSTFWTEIVSEPVKVKKYLVPEIQEDTGPAIKPKLYNDCDTKKDCVGFPNGCISQKSCTSLVTIIAGNNDNMEIEMMSLNSKYIAIGISEDIFMGGDYVIDCAVYDDQVYASESWNVPNRKENNRIPTRDILKLKSGKFSDGNIYCSATLSSRKFDIEGVTFDFERKSYYLLLAAGKAVENSNDDQNMVKLTFHDNGYIVSDQYLMKELHPNKPEDPFYKGCNTVVNCFGIPNDCIQKQNCELAVRIITQGVNYRFRLRGKSTGYVAVGLSQDDKMGEDSVMECVNNGRNVAAYMSWNIAGSTRGNTREGVSQIGLNLISGNASDGMIECEFTRETITTTGERTFDLINDRYYLLLASGSSLRDNGVSYHDIIAVASGEKRSLSDVRMLQEADKLLIRLHGAFMIAAWIGTASIGIVLARYFKQTWVESSLCSKDLWFAWHRFFMLLTWCLTITGCILIFVDVGDWVSQNSQNHAILGVITIALCFIQPIGAAFRPHPTAKNRPVFNWLHWLIGNGAHICAIVTIFLAVQLTKAQLPRWLDWILVAFVAFYVLVHIIFSFAGCISEEKVIKRVNSFPLKEMNASRGGTSERKQDAPLAGFRKFILFIHIVYITGLTAAIIVIVVLAPIGTQWKSLQNKFMM